jgi:cytochrome d ubiquinol oxidase subunit I
VSPVTRGEVAISLLAFMAIYALVFSVGALYILRLIDGGPRTKTEEVETPRPPGYALGAAPHGPGSAP